GEGLQLHNSISGHRGRCIHGVGLDSAKGGIIMSCNNYHNPIWLVGDLANIRLTDQSSHVVLNILSPANYMEFKRVLAPEGIIVKIVPRPNYLKELREVIFTNSDKKAYTNGETISLFKQNFQLVNN